MIGSSFVDGIRVQYDVALPYCFSGTLSQARSAATSQCKYLVICLHSCYHEYGEEFFTRVLGNNEVVVQFMERTIFFGAYVDNNEGERLAEQYKVRELPSLVVIFKNQVAMTIGGPFTAEKLLKEWYTCTGEWDSLAAQEISIKADRDERQRQIDEDNRKLEELEREDIERLRRFEEQQQQKRKEEQRHLDLERERLAAEDAQAKEEERIAQSLEEHRLQVARLEREKAEACANLHEEPGPEENEIVTLRFRCPKGGQLTRRFKKSDCVDQLLFYIKSLPFFDGSTLNFVCGYPPAPVEWEPGVTCFADMKRLTSNTVINVRMVLA